jgi:hypothetical protein
MSCNLAIDVDVREKWEPTGSHFFSAGFAQSMLRLNLAASCIVDSYYSTPRPKPLRASAWMKDSASPLLDDSFFAYSAALARGRPC